MAVSPLHLQSWPEEGKRIVPSFSPFYENWGDLAQNLRNMIMSATTDTITDTHQSSVGPTAVENAEHPPTIDRGVSDLSRALSIERDFLHQRHRLDKICHAFYVPPLKGTKTNGLAEHVEPGDMQWVSFPSPTDFSCIVSQAQTAHLDLLTMILKNSRLRYNFCLLAHLFEVAMSTRPEEVAERVPQWVASSNKDERTLAERHRQELFMMQKNMQKAEGSIKPRCILFQSEPVVPAQLDSDKLDWVFLQICDIFHQLNLNHDLQLALRQILDALSRLPEDIMERPPFSLDVRVNADNRLLAQHVSTSDARGAADRSSNHHDADPGSIDPLHKVFPCWDTLMQEVQNILLSTQTDQTFKFYASGLFRWIDMSMTRPGYTQADDFFAVGRYCMDNVFRLLWLPRYHGPVMRLMQSIVAFMDQLWVQGGQTEASLAFQNGLASLVSVVKPPETEATVTQATTRTQRGGIRGADMDRVPPSLSLRGMFNAVALIEDAIVESGLFNEPMELPSIYWKDKHRLFQLDNICLEFPAAHAHNMHIASSLDYCSDSSTEGRRWAISIHGVEMAAENMLYFYESKNLMGQVTHDVGKCHLRVPHNSLDVDIVVILQSPLHGIDPMVPRALRKDLSQIWDRHLIAKGVVNEMNLGTRDRKTRAQPVDSSGIQEGARIYMAERVSEPRRGTSTTTFITSPSHVGYDQEQHHQQCQLSKVKGTCKVASRESKAFWWMRNILYPNWDKVTALREQQQHQNSQIFSPFRAFSSTLRGNTDSSKLIINTARSRRGSSVRVIRSNGDTRHAPIRPVNPQGLLNATTSDTTVAGAARSNGSGSKSSDAPGSHVSPSGGDGVTMLTETLSRAMARPTDHAIPPLGPHPGTSALPQSQSQSAQLQQQPPATKTVELLELKACKVSLRKIELELVETTHPIYMTMTHALLVRRIRKLLQDHIQRMLVELVRNINAGVTNVVRVADELKRRDEQQPSLLLASSVAGGGNGGHVPVSSMPMTANTVISPLQPHTNVQW